MGDPLIDIQHRDWSESLAAMRDAGGARLIVVSPPYPDARTAEAFGGAYFDTTLEGYGRFGAAIFEALIPGGVCVLNIDGPVRVWRPELGESERSLIAFEVAIDWAKRIGFRYVEHGAYVRWGMPIGHDNNPRFRSGWEPVHVFARPGAGVYFNRYGSTRPAGWFGSVRKTAKRAARRPDGSIAAFGKPGYVQGERRALTTAEHYDAQNTGDGAHAASFCFGFAEDFVLCYSAPGDTVGDPMVGSGTTAVVANKHGRRFIGGDIGHRDRDGRRWSDIAREACAQQTLNIFEATDVR